MEYTKVVNGSEMVVSIGGKLDTETAPHFEQEIIPQLTAITSLVLDLGDLEYISSSGLRVLLALKKVMSAAKGDLCIKNTSEAVKSVFHISGFDIILDVQ